MDLVSNRRPKTSSRNSKENTDQREIRQTVDRSKFHKVSFNTRDELGDKIDMLTVVMSKLVAKDSNEKRPFKPQIYKNRGQSRSYDQRKYQNRGNMSDSRNRGQYGNNRLRQN